MNVNKAIIIGRLTRNPESRTTPSGQMVCSFSMATSRTWKNSSGEKQEKTDFHNIIAWGKLAELCQTYLIKGQMVYVEGRIENRSWEGPDGAKRSRTEIVTENLRFGPKPRGAANEVQTAPEEANVEAAPEEEINVEEVPF